MRERRLGYPVTISSVIVGALGSGMKKAIKN